MPNPDELTRRERQIMDAVYELGQATVADVRSKIPDPPGYSAVRAMVTRLEKKGFLRHRPEGTKYLYSPVVRRSRARESATRRLVSTFFGESPMDAVKALLDLAADKLTEDELDELAAKIEQARKAGR